MGTRGSRVPDKSLPDQPNLEQYEKQAKNLLHAQAEPAALDRIARHHPRLNKQPLEAISLASFRFSDSQLVIARENGFENWREFVRRIATLRLSREVNSPNDPASACIQAAYSPRHGHKSGTVDEAEMILARYPRVGLNGRKCYLDIPCSR